MLETLHNYRQISDKIHSSGQPTVDDFKLIHQAGIKTIINLARTDSPNAISNEAEIAHEKNLDYIHIPVDFKKPNTPELELFFNTMEQHNSKTILVHCAYNWRVACFVYLYRIIKQDCNNEIATQDMLSVWTPDKTWQTFINKVLQIKNN